MSEQVPRVIYQFWTGENPISDNRRIGIKSLVENSGVPCRLLMPEDIERERLHDVHFHPAYQYLSVMHKSDYLRCYWMHHFGGGYADIKHYSKNNNWMDAFEYIDAHQDIDIVGQEEIPGGSPIRPWNVGDDLKKLVSNSYFVVRPHSECSTIWWNLLNGKLDDKYEELKAHPAKELRDKGKTSGYPLRWAEIMGELFHQVCHGMYDNGCISSMLKSGREWVEYQ